MLVLLFLNRIGGMKMFELNGLRVALLLLLITGLSLLTTAYETHQDVFYWSVSFALIGLAYIAWVLAETK